jgi:predicted lipoprotein with Yx(FWY)xxD motif
MFTIRGKLSLKSTSILVQAHFMPLCDHARMKYHIVAVSVAALSMFSACSGDGGGTSAYGTAVPAAQTTPSPAPALTISSFSTPNSGRGTQSGFAATNGFAIYDFDLDINPPAGIPLGTSACNGPAAGSTEPATFWPPVPAPVGVALAAPFGVSKRLDGTLQLTYNGHPPAIGTSRKPPPDRAC